MLQVRDLDEAYSKGKPLVSDEVYDALVGENHFTAEADYEGFIRKPHTQPMGSLGKAYTMEKLIEWALDSPSHTFSITVKLDGISIAIDGDTALTRGDGSSGFDIYRNVQKMTWHMPPTGMWRAEIVGSMPRAEVAGIARRLNGEGCEHLHVVPFSKDAKPYLEKTLICTVGRTELAKIAVDEECLLYEGQVIFDRRTYPFAVDGLVWYDDRGDAIALKFPSKGGETELIDAEWEVGKSGKVTATGIYTPLLIDGRKLSRATLNSAQFCENLRIGATIYVEQRGDVIPQVARIVDYGDGPSIMITHCPSCNSELRRVGAHLYCEADNCGQRQTQRLINWCRVMGIPGVSEISAQAIGTLERLYTMTPLEYMELRGANGRKISNGVEIYVAVQQARSAPIDRALEALGLPGIGPEVAKRLVRQGYAQNIRELKDLEEIGFTVLPMPETNGRVFTLTGTRNRRIIDAIIESGAEYSEKWNKRVTHLVAASTGTQKARAAAHKGVVVIPEEKFFEWLEQNR